MKKITGIEGQIIDAAVIADYENAQVFEKIRVGAAGVFLPHNLTVKYIPFSYIDNAFKRINEVNGRLCCGNASFYYYRLVLAHDGKEFIDYLTENEKTIDDALRAIASADGRIKIGYEKDNT